MSRLPPGMMKGLLALVGLTTLAWVGTLAAPSRTAVQITITPEGALARVNDATLALERPPEQRAAGHWGWYVAAERESVAYQPADPSTALVSLGRVGEWIQEARPAPRWEFPPTPGAAPPVTWQPVPGAVAEAGAAVAPDSATTPGARLDAVLVGGRGPAGLFTHLNAAGDGYALVVRADRRTIGWWRVTGGVPVEALTTGIYRPTLAAGVADLIQEAALTLSGALLLVLVMGGLVVGGGFFLQWRERGGFRFRDMSSQQSAPTGVGSLPPASEASARRLRADRLLILAWGLAGVLLTLAVCLGPLEGIPHVQDDAAYFWQARVFAQGQAWAPEPPLGRFFEHAFVVFHDGRWFAKYPPGWPLVLAPGVGLDLPWLINPLCAGATVALIYLIGRRLYGPPAGGWAALLTLTSPFFLFMSGSYMAHPSTALALTVALYGFVRLMQPDPAAPPSGWGRVGWSVLTGFSLGWAFISREATALGVAAPFIAWGLVATARLLAAVFVPRWRTPTFGAQVRHWLPFGVIALAGLIPLMVIGVVNQAQMGSPFRLAQELVGAYDRLGFGPGFGPEEGGHSPALGLYNALIYLRALEVVLFGWPLPLTLAPLLIGVLGIIGASWREARWTLFLLAGFLGLVAAYFAWWSATLIFGPRYWYEACPFLWLLTGYGLARLSRGVAALAQAGAAPDRAGRALAVGIPALVVGSLVVFNLAQFFPRQVRAYTGYNGIDGSSLRRVAEARVNQALVFVALQPAYPNRDYGKVFFANDPWLRGPVVYARDLGAEGNRALAAAFPDRTPYYLPLIGPLHPGVGP